MEEDSRTTTYAADELVVPSLRHPPRPLTTEESPFEIQIESNVLRQAISNHIKSLHPVGCKRGIFVKDFDSSKTCFHPVGTVSFEFEEHLITYTRSRVSDKGLASKAWDRDIMTHDKVTLTCDDLSVMARFCELAEKGGAGEGCIDTFVWKADASCWRRRGIVNQRSLNSVVLDQTLKEKLLQDVDKFGSSTTMNWYTTHGIPYKRGYLFHGPPGTGKTSFIRALATYTRRHVHIISLVQGHLTDTNLMSAMEDVINPAIVVFEDVDSLFDNHREKMDNFALTFSGFLNAIDGVTVSVGTMFIFTTNFKNRLDPALLRKGRIDYDVLFEKCSHQVAKTMFLRFYPEADESLGNTFATLAQGSTQANLQDHFIQCQGCEASEAARYDSSTSRGEEDSHYMHM